MSSRSEFRALWLSVILSAAGDRLALVALAVWSMTGPGRRCWPPWRTRPGTCVVIGGLFFADLADRRPRRTVMVASTRSALSSSRRWPCRACRLRRWSCCCSSLPCSPRRSSRPARRSLPACARRALRAGYRGDPDQLPDRRGGRRGRREQWSPSSACGLPADRHRYVSPPACSWARHAGQARRGQPGCRPGLAAGAGAAGRRLVFGDRALRTLVLLGWLVVFYPIPQGIAARTRPGSVVARPPPAWCWRPP